MLGRVGRAGPHSLHLCLFFFPAHGLWCLIYKGDFPSFSNLPLSSYLDLPARRPPRSIQIHAFYHISTAKLFSTIFTLPSNMKLFNVLIQAIVLACSVFVTTSAAPMAVPEPQQSPSNSTAPQSSSAPISESEPWILTHIKKFEATSANGVSYITFDLEDTNDRIQLKTTCTRVVLPGKGNILDGATTVSCANPDVAFSYDGSTIKIQRSYNDPA